MKIGDLFLMSYRKLPDDFVRKYASIYIELPSELLDPVEINMDHSSGARGGQPVRGRIVGASLTTTVSAETVWEFVRDMDHWAPFLLGYQAHDKQSDDESIWTIKADVGAMSRTVDFRVHITEWAEPERIRFTIEGIGEPMNGDGSFTIEVIDPSEVAAAMPVAEPRAPGFFVRLWAMLLRRLLRQGQGQGRGEGDGRGALAPHKGPQAVRLTFRLSMTPEGATAPMLNAMIKPVMLDTAEDLAQRIVAHLEAR